jgi:hypothetical protein
MKELLFTLSFMTIVSFSFCKKEACKTTTTTETRTTTYTELDSLSSFKGQNTLNFIQTVHFVTADGNGVGCGHGGCINGGLKILNLTSKTAKIKLFGSERDILYNQPHKILLTCSPNSLLSINDDSFSFLDCTSNLSKMIKVSYD